MKKLKAVLLFLLAVLILIPITLYAQNNEIGKILTLSGRCYVKHESNEEYIPIDEKTTVYSNDTVRTEKNSYVEIELTDGSSLKIEEDSEVSLSSLTLGKNTHTRIGLLIGTIKLVINRIVENRDFNIDTVTFTAGVRGTELTVASRSDGESLLNVDKGEVELSSDSTRETVKGGESVIFTIYGEKRKLKRTVNYREWRRKGYEIMKQNPDLVLKHLYTRELIIIRRLKEMKKKLKEYSENWRKFLIAIKRLEEQKRYKEEKMLIRKEMARTRRGLILVLYAKRELIRIRSIMAITYRVDREAGKKLDRQTLQKIKREYVRIGYTVRKLNEIEKLLRRVLYYLNVKYYKLK